MRRSLLVSLLVGVLALGAASLAPSANAAGSLLCPPGCVLSGVAQGIGGVPAEGQLYIYGSITAVDTRTGDVQGAASVGHDYFFTINGSSDVHVDANGVVTGHADLFANYWNYSTGTYDHLQYNVVLAGTRNRLELHRVNDADGVQLYLDRALGGWTGTIVAWDAG